MQTVSPLLTFYFRFHTLLLQRHIREAEEGKLVPVSLKICVNTIPTWRMQVLWLHHPMQLSLLSFICSFSTDLPSLIVTCIMSSPLKRLKRSSNEAEEPIFFFSGSRWPYCQLSNFFQVDIEMEEGVFPSVEHYFQGMKFIPEDRKRFMKGGEFDRKKETAATNAKEETAKGRLAKSAGSKSGSAKYKLTLAPDGLDQEVAKRRMKRALQKKFEKEPFKSLLLENGASRQLIHIPTRGQTDFWTGKRDKKTREIVGKNTMGKLLMEVRDSLLSEAHDSNDQNVTSRETEVMTAFE